MLINSFIDNQRNSLGARTKALALMIRLTFEPRNFTLYSTTLYLQFLKKNGNAYASMDLSYFFTSETVFTNTQRQNFKFCGFVYLNRGLKVHSCIDIAILNQIV